ncbi:MAG: amino acid ABC transporter permease [Eubacteriales bacterium]|nr:amino acid ABC transporter permease [Eubacteriales bacterium]
MEAITRILTPENLQFMIKGAGYSILVAVGALLGGSVLGLLSAVMKMGKIKILRFIANIYVEVIRGTPMMLQILLLYLCGPVITRAIFGFVFTPNPILVGVIAVGINSGAYTTELFRSAIQSVDKGQWEAAQTIGLSYWQTMRYVILPQAFKRILPPYINEFIVLIKDSSLLASIGAVELLHSAEVLGAKYYNYLVPLLCATVMYLVMTLTISYFARKLERRLAQSD